MKRLFFTIVPIILYLVTSCKEYTYPSILIEADELTYTYPDSAVTLLHSLEKEMKTHSKEVQMYYELLCIKAKDKAYITHTTDSNILAIIDYFTKEDKEHLPEALYYAGRVYRDLGDAPRAIIYFQQALNQMEEKISPYLSNRINSQMGTLFSEQNMYAEAIEAYKKALQISMQEQDTVSMIYDLRDIGNTFCDMESYDSASVYLGRAYQHVCVIKEEKIKGMIESQLSYLYTQLKQYDKAKYYINLSLKRMDQHMLSSTYTIAAELYKKTGHKDSALHFYKELMKNGELYARTDAAWNLAQYALQDNKTKEANLYMKQYIAGIDTVWALNNTEKIRQLRSTYNYNLREQENNRLKWENKQKQIHLVGALSSIIILFVCFLAYIQYSQKKQVQMKLQLEKLKQLEEKQETENFILKEKNIEKWKYFQSTEICQYFFQCIEQKTYHIADEKWKELENILNITYDQFTEKLQDIHRLSIYEMRLCMLLKMNISPKDMAILTNHSKESVTSTRRRMYKKFFGVKGCPQDWDKFIKTL